MKIIIILLNIIILSSAQSSLFPPDSLTSPWSMTSLPHSISSANLIQQYEKSGITVNYKYGSKIINANIFDCGSNAISMDFYSVLYSYLGNPKLRIYSDSTIVGGVPTIDTSFLYKPIGNLMININTDSSSISIDEARKIELFIIQNIIASPVKYYLIPRNNINKKIKNRYYLINGKFIGNNILPNIKYHQFIINK